MQKKKVYKYHKSHNFLTKEGDKVSFVTQLYVIGVYGIINGNPALQGNFTPKQIVDMEKRLNKSFEKGEITDLQFGRLLTVEKTENGFEEVLQTTKQLKDDNSKNN